MQLAPLQLTDYFVHSLRVDASSDFNSEKKTDLDIDSLQVEHECIALNDAEYPHYHMAMTIRQDLVPGKNIPYSYELRMVGRICASPDFPAEKLQRAVEVNGPSMLFGAAREILRAATGHGPYGQVLIPSTTFFKPVASRTTTEPAKTTSTTAPAKKTPDKKTVEKITRKPKTQ